MKAAMAGILIGTCATIATGLAPNDQMDAWSSLAWKAGEEVRIETGTDAAGYYTVYVPLDYTPDEAWPILFYYHGLGGSPTTNVIRAAGNDRYFIVVGMDYHKAGFPDGFDYLQSHDIPTLKRILADLRGHLSIDPDRVFVGGFSKGGYYSCELLRLVPDLLAGALVLGAGCLEPEWNGGELPAKRVFIGIGDRDGRLSKAVWTARRFKQLGADVTFETWPGVGHSVGDLRGLRRWLFTNSAARPRLWGQRGRRPDRGVGGKPSSVGQVLLAIVAGTTVLAGIATAWKLRGRLATDQKSSADLQ